jgi:hypothetical protein
MNIQGVTPSIFAPVLNPVAKAAASSNASSSASSSMGSSAASLQSTFLNLLVTEMQNQDPTSPVDPTTMVSQMVSLNQLDQLISMNQTLSKLTSTSTTTTSGGATPTGGTKQPINTTPVASALGSFSSHSGGSGSGLVNSVTSLAAPLLQIPAELTGIGIPKAIMNLYSGFRSATPTSQSTSTGAR